jgi:hypothetical protein
MSAILQQFPWVGTFDASDTLFVRYTEWASRQERLEDNTPMSRRSSAARKRLAEKAVRTYCSYQVFYIAGLHYQNYQSDVQSVFDGFLQSVFDDFALQRSTLAAAMTGALRNATILDDKRQCLQEVLDVFGDLSAVGGKHHEAALARIASDLSRCRPLRRSHLSPPNNWPFYDYRSTGASARCDVCTHASCTSCDKAATGRFPRELTPLLGWAHRSGSSRPATLHFDHTRSRTEITISSDNNGAICRTPANLLLDHPVNTRFNNSHDCVLHVLRLVGESYIVNHARSSPTRPQITRLWTGSGVVPKEVQRDGSSISPNQ